MIRMSVSDPLIKDIKAHVLKFWNEASQISDENPNLIPFCETIEKIFHFGLIPSHQHSLTNFNKTSVDSYNWLAKLNNYNGTSFAYSSSLDKVEQCRNIHTKIGRFRLLIRCCLVKKCVQIPMEYLNRSGKSNTIYQTNSINGDEILREIFLSVLLQCSKINFLLDLNNTAFLDYTWELPKILKLELVPCKNLGISVSFSNEKAVVVNIEPNGVVAENGQIEIGDIIDNLNGIYINSTSKGRLKTIFHINKGQPIQLIIIKCFNDQNHSIFPPIKKLLKDLEIDLNYIENNNKKNHEKIEKNRNKNQKAGFETNYIGNVDIGNKGNVKQVEKAIRSILSTNTRDNNNFNSKVIKKSVLFEIGEIGVKVLDSEDSNKIVLKHSYMQISSCGSAPYLPNYFAYIASEENCDLSNHFICYVFYSKNIEESALILQSIGQGFYRTHFAV